MDSIKLTIDDVEVKCLKGDTILSAARKNGIYIPSLCYHSSLPVTRGYEPEDVVFRGGVEARGDSHEHYSGCRLCVVHVEGDADVVTACDTEAKEGMNVFSNSIGIAKARRDSLLTILAGHPHECLQCPEVEVCNGTECLSGVPEPDRCCGRAATCELRKVAAFVGIGDHLPTYTFRDLPKLENPLYTVDYNLCIGCLRCVRACNDVRGINALGFVRKNGEIVVGTKASTLNDSGCRFCMACAEVCPTGAILDNDLKGGDRTEALVPCAHACPAGIDIPEYVRYVAAGQYDTALAVISEKVPFPNSLGYVCFHPCESACRRGKVNEPIAICNIKRLAAANGSGKWRVSEHITLKKIAKKNATGKKVAVIGAGPAGLATAYFLALKGHKVTIFDKDAQAGGMMRYAIPEYRLPKTILDNDLEYIRQIGVKFEGSKRVNVSDIAPKYDATVIASGNPLARKLRIGGTELSGVLWGLDFLRLIGLGAEVKLKGKVVVVGGSHVAVNVALCAKRLGASEVAIVCVEKLEEMPAYKREIDQAIEEGVKLYGSWGPLVVKGDDEQRPSDVLWGDGYSLTGKKIVRGASGKVRGIEFMRYVSDFDDDERLVPQYDDCEIQYFDADTVIFAIGQTPDATFIDMDDIKTKRGMIETDHDYMTDMKGVFACGEATKAPGSVIDAIAQGREAASHIDFYLGGDGGVYFELYEKLAPNPKIGRREDFAKEARQPMPTLPVEERNNFSLVELGYTEDQARKEAGRCLQCDLRLTIEPVAPPPEPASSSAGERKTEQG
jgi:formate dehydrogenase (NADP+) beta subunit